MSNAPIALFVFNRPDHTRRTLDGLVANPELATSPIYVFCDGPRSVSDVPAVSAARQVVRGFGLRQATLVEHMHNKGLANSISEGVTRVCAEHGRVIVMEDDLLASRHLLAYMNGALDRFAECASVMQVSGHCFFASGYERTTGCSFLPFTTSWGWATWKRAWDTFDASMTGYESLLRNRARRREFNLRGAHSYTGMMRKLERSGRLNNSWALRWYWSLFKQNGLVLFPHRTLIRHFGDDGSGTNVRGRQQTLDTGFSLENRVSSFPVEIAVDEAFYGAVRKTIARQQSALSRGLRFARRFLA